MNCLKCGKLVDESARFCSSCGAELLIVKNTQTPLSATQRPEARPIHTEIPRSPTERGATSASPSHLQESINSLAPQRKWMIAVWIAWLIYGPAASAVLGKNVWAIWSITGVIAFRDWTAKQTARQIVVRQSVCEYGRRIYMPVMFRFFWKQVLLYCGICIVLGIIGGLPEGLSSQTIAERIGFAIATVLIPSLFVVDVPLWIKKKYKHCVEANEVQRQLTYNGSESDAPKTCSTTTTRWERFILFAAYFTLVSFTGASMNGLLKHNCSEQAAAMLLLVSVALTVWLARRQFRLICLKSISDNPRSRLSLFTVYGRFTLRFCAFMSVIVILVCIAVGELLTVVSAALAYGLILYIASAIAGAFVIVHIRRQYTSQHATTLPKRAVSVTGLIYALRPFAVVVILVACVGIVLKVQSCWSTQNEVTKWNIGAIRDKAESGDAKAQCKLAAAYAKGTVVPLDLAEAVKWYHKAAEQGNAVGQCDLGLCYYEGKGVKRDIDEAVKWWRKAAEQGNGPAQWNLGVSYEEGKGIPKDLVEALKWERKAAETGYVVAQYHLGKAYLRGNIFTKNEAEGVKWLSKAANNGNSTVTLFAQDALGDCYAEGTGVSVNLVEAYKLYRKVAEQPGFTQVGVKLGDCYAKGNGVEQNFGKAVEWYRKSTYYYVAKIRLGDCYSKGEGVVQNMEEAVKWYRVAADEIHGYDSNRFNEAAFKLGNCYARGQGVLRDTEEAVRWYRKGSRELDDLWRKAEGGDGLAQFNLACRYASGSLIANDNSEAAKWYWRAAERGIPGAHYALAVRFAKGEGVQKDMIEAGKSYRRWISSVGSGSNVQLHLQAAVLGISDAQFTVGTLYYYGNGVSKDVVEAVKWYRKAAEQGNANAQCNLGLCYANGDGVAKDEVEALAWFNLAAASGDETSKKNRAIMEYRLGRQVTILAQQRSKELLEKIQQEKDRAATSPGETGTAETTGDEPKATGSGVFITGDGIILSAAHVVRGAFKVRVVTSKGIKTAKVLQVDEANDVVILKCEGAYAPSPVVSSGGVRLGQVVFTLGFPNVGLQGFEPKLTKGEISSMGGIQDDPRQWQISAPVQPGNSGGPLFNENGNVVGVVVARLSDRAAIKSSGAIPQNINYAVKSAYVMPLLESLGNRLPPARKAGSSAKFEDVVQKARESAVLILAY